MSPKILFPVLLIVGGLSIGVAEAGPFFWRSPVSIQQETIPAEPMPLPTLPPGAQPYAETPVYVEPIASPEAVVLYDNVVYKDLHRKHPCAVPYLVSIPNPWARKCDPCASCQPGCVNVMICVPPCDHHQVKVRRGGKKLRYDFGKYEVDVVVRRSGLVVVDYDA